MDFSLEPEIRGLPFPKPHPCITALINASIRANCRFLGSSVGIGPRQLRYPHAAADEGDINLPRTKNLRAVQLLLGHSKLESTVRYLGIEVDDALEMAEQTEA